MPIIPTVGRKAPSIRILIAALYVILTLGAVTMVYPFLLMLSTSVTSSTDMNDYRVVPRYLHDGSALFAKVVDDKYAGDIELVNATYHTDFKKGPDVTLPPTVTPEQRRLAEAWDRLAVTFPLDWKTAAFRGYGKHPSPLKRAYQRFCREKFGGDIRALNRAYTEENESFNTVGPPQERPNKRNWNPDPSPKMRDFVAWKAGLPESWKPVFSVDYLFGKYLKEDVPAYKGDVKKAAADWGSHASFYDVQLPESLPAGAEAARLWEAFVRTKLPFRYIRPASEALENYRAFLRGRYDSIEKLNKAYSTAYADFTQVGFPESIPDAGLLNVDWGDFIAKAIPLRMIRLDTPEIRFRRSLGAAGAGLAAPYYASEAAYVTGHAAELRGEYATRNYRYVIDYILLHGRALTVTLVFCLAVILTTLVVNPLCAYALSRFSLPYAYKILLFVLATMAFPAEVAMIPNFLLLKQLGLLNTYWALVLPGAASGFSIFLLKGFFDSLPKELYEAGTLDGASDTRMFFNIAVPLSKPIFAVIALQAFTAAYGAFMFALIVCQNPKMWTLMVWLYELQVTEPTYIMMAGLTVAALPTLLVFVFAQNVIMRGIILPTEK